MRIKKEKMWLCAALAVGLVLGGCGKREGGQELTFANQGKCTDWSKNLQAKLWKFKTNNKVLCDRHELEKACRAATGLKKMKGRCVHFADEFINSCNLNPAVDVEKFVDHTFTRPCYLETGAQGGADSNHIVVASLNGSSRQTNAFEFRSALKGTKYHEDHDKFLDLVRDEITGGSILLSAFAETVKKDQIIGIANILLSKKQGVSVSQDTLNINYDGWVTDNQKKIPSEVFAISTLEPAKPGGVVDVTLRKEGAPTVPSFMHGWQPPTGSFFGKSKMTPAEYAQFWAEEMQKAVDSKNFKLGKFANKLSNNAPQEIAMLGFLDYILYKVAYDNDMLKKISDMQKEFQSLILEKKDQVLARHAARANVVGTQETTEGLRKEMENLGFFTKSQKGDAQVFLRKDVWEQGKTSLVAHAIEGYDSKKKENVGVQDRVSIVKTKKIGSDLDFYFASAHSKGSGSDSVDIINGIKRTVDADPTDGTYRLFVMHDANTAQGSQGGQVEMDGNSYNLLKEGKMDLGRYMNTEKSIPLLPAYHKSTKYPYTVKKARGYPQVQFKKAELLSLATSDHILSSLNLRHVVHMISPGMNPYNTTDHAIVFTDFEFSELAKASVSETDVPCYGEVAAASN